MTSTARVILPVILCGGSGTRLWPLSRIQVPKQFLCLFDEYSLLQHTMLRVSEMSVSLPPLIICNQQYRFMVGDHLQQIEAKASAILLEPASRNTAPAIAAALAWAEQHAPEAVLLVLPSDHLIQNKAAFIATVEAALLHLPADALLTFGITPTHPEPNYGYVMAPTQEASGLRKVERFVEKPPLAKAAQMLSESGWYWNSGMFAFTVAAGVAAYQQHAADILAIARQALAEGQAEGHSVLLPACFTSANNVSFDHAVMEKATHCALMPLAANWADLGTWASLWEHSPKTADGNVINGQVMAHASHHNYLHSPKRLLTVAGLDNLVVIDTDDALLVAHIDHAGHAKQFAQALAASQAPQAMQHTHEQRPWGMFQNIDQGERFKVKRITVKPGAKLSLQLHHHRAEHWVVVSGHARVTCGTEQFELKANQSSYIPVGTVHRLENIGSDLLEIIEVQTGERCDEADIVRYQDDYQRAGNALV